MGINGYSEAKEVLQVSLYLMHILNEQTDIDTVYISRTNDNQSVSLYQRTNYANTVSASWYHSVTAMLVRIQIQTGHFYFGANSIVESPTLLLGGGDE